MILVALGYQIHAGKDTAAQALMDRLSFTRMAFGDELKEEVLKNFRRTLKAICMATISLDVDYPVDLRWSARVDKDEEWWTRKLRYMLWTLKPAIVRALLQEYGTELRRGDDPNYWIKKAENTLYKKRSILYTLHGTTEYEKFVFTDLRFLNEAEMIHKYRGVCIKVHRPSLENTSSHQSENDLIAWNGWDFVLVNDGSVADLESKVCELVHGLLS